MPYITPLDEIKKLKHYNLVHLSCTYCGKHFERTKYMCNFVVYGYNNRKFFCNKKCIYKSREKPKHVKKCLQCNIVFKSANFRESNRKFCSQSCAATYNNTHKTKGIRVSRLEKWLQQQLLTLYPDIEIYFNQKNAIDSELDIYIPSLQLAFELNGVFHYKPIFSESQLISIQENDKLKLQACIKRNIELHVIDTTSQGRFTESTSIPFLTQITTTINNKLTTQTDHST